MSTHLSFYVVNGPQMRGSEPSQPTRPFRKQPDEEGGLYSCTRDDAKSEGPQVRLTCQKERANPRDGKGHRQNASLSV